MNKYSIEKLQDALARCKAKQKEILQEGNNPEYEEFAKGFDVGAQTVLDEVEKWMDNFLG